MRYRALGRTGWQVSEIGYGMWGLAGWLDSDDRECWEALKRSVELGCNFFDTALAYGDGKSERILGELVRHFSERRLYIGTKIPPMNRKWPSRRGYKIEDVFPSEYLEESLEISLKNLGLSSVDLLQFHVWEDDWTDTQQWAKTIDRFKSDGLIRAVGISINRWEPWNGIRALRTGVIDTVQVIYNLFDQNPEDELFPVCQELNIGVIARVPFDEGSLTGTLTKKSSWPAGDWRNSYFVKENLDASVDRAEALKQVIPSDSTLPEIALRFCLSHPAVCTVIPGMRSIKHVEANCHASDLGELSAPLLDRLAEHRWDRKPTEWSQ
jgi:aryl-alcohol dehydrogenase-like predicted oxidoreductase